MEERLTEEQCGKLFQRLFPNGLTDPFLVQKLAPEGRERREVARDAEVADLRRNLDEAYRESVEEARHDPPPATVRAHQRVYDRFPAGWPPEGEGENSS